MAKEFLDDPPRPAPLQQMRRVGVAERVDGGVFGAAALAHDHFEGLLEGGRRQGRWLAPGREQPGPGALTLPVLSQELQGPVGQGPIAVFAPFAPSDPDQHALGGDVRDLQLRPFPQAPSTGIDHPQTHAGFRLVDQGQQVPDLLRTPHDWQCLAVSGSNEVEDRPWSLQRALVEEPDPIEVNAEGALGDLLLVEQEQEGPAELFCAELVGRAPVVLSQMADSVDITLLGLGGEPPELQIFEHTASEGSHLSPPVRVADNPSQTVDTNRKIHEPSELGKRRRKTEHQ